MATKLPVFSYTGSYKTDLKNGRWYIFFLTSGTLKMNYGKTGDVYLHGGGGCGGDSSNPGGGGGGGGGYLATHTGIRVEAGKAYSIVVGDGGTHITASGSASSAFGYSVQGGGGGDRAPSGGGGGAGGIGGSGNGGTGGGSTGGFASPGGSNTTYAFNDPSLGLLYGGGGSGGGPRYGGDAAGGAPYGARGGERAGANTGAGGGGVNWTEEEYGYRGCWGGSGIVILRSTQDDVLPVIFDGTGVTNLFFNGTEITGLIYNGVRLFFERLKRRGKKRYGGAVYGTG